MKRKISNPYLVLNVPKHPLTEVFKMGHVKNQGTSGFLYMIFSFIAAFRHRILGQKECQCDPIERSTTKQSLLPFVPSEKLNDSLWVYMLFSFLKRDTKNRWKIKSQAPSACLLIKDTSIFLLVPSPLHVSVFLPSEFKTSQILNSKSKKDYLSTPLHNLGEWNRAYKPK